MPVTAPVAIPAEIRAIFGQLRLRARRPQPGRDLGQHASHHRGAGLEFAQYRGYEPGDELRRIDWKLYARSDRFFVRDAERDSPLTLWVLVDATASMAQADRARPGFSKLDAARQLAASLVELAVSQRDRCGLVIVGGAPGPQGQALQIIPADTGSRHRDRIHLALAALRPQGQWPAESALRGLWSVIAPAAQLVALSDGFDDALIDLLARLAAARREPSLIQLLSGEERDFPFKGAQRFRDPETGEFRDADASVLRNDFLARFNAARQALAQRLGAAGVAHCEAFIDRPLSEPLLRLFSGRVGEGRT